MVWNPFSRPERVVFLLYTTTTVDVYLPCLLAKHCSDSELERRIAQIENITFFEPTPNLDKVIEAAKGAYIWQEIQAMPMGLHSQAGDLGSALSGGQKQRLLLARALYSQPKILFLDEATSHLDSKTEMHVNQYLKEKCITRISVAHRQETIESADRIINLESLINKNRVELAS